MEKTPPVLRPFLFPGAESSPYNLPLSTTMTLFPLWLRYCGRFFPVPRPPAQPGCRIFPLQQAPPHLLRLPSLPPLPSSLPLTAALRTGRSTPPSLLRFCPSVYPGLDKSFCPIKLCAGEGDGTTGIINVVHLWFGNCGEDCALCLHLFPLIIRQVFAVLYRGERTSRWMNWEPGSYIEWSLQSLAKAYVKSMSRLNLEIHTCLIVLHIYTSVPLFITRCCVRYTLSDTSFTGWCVGWVSGADGNWSGGRGRVWEKGMLVGKEGVEEIFQLVKR